VALLVAELVGPGGNVLGIDRSVDALSMARARAEARGLANVTFDEEDVHGYEHGDFDAVVGRLVLLYTPDPAAVVRHHATRLRRGGVVLAMEYDMLAARAIPTCPTAETAIRWINETFARAGLDPTLGPKLASVLREAGLDHPTTVGIQPYLDPSPGAGMVAAIVRTLVPAMERTGVATSSEVDIETLATRLAAELTGAGAVLAPPTLVGAWATVG
jgi:SAM-dependent methyltransferase